MLDHKIIKLGNKILNSNSTQEIYLIRGLVSKIGTGGGVHCTVRMGITGKGAHGYRLRNHVTGRATGMGTGRSAG